jgi:hypothetical protein
MRVRTSCEGHEGGICAFTAIDVSWKSRGMSVLNIAPYRHIAYGHYPGKGLSLFLMSSRWIQESDVILIWYRSWLKNTTQKSSSFNAIIKSSKDKKLTINAQTLRSKSDKVSILARLRSSFHCLTSRGKQQREKPNRESWRRCNSPQGIHAVQNQASQLVHDFSNIPSILSKQHPNLGQSSCQDICW